MMRVKVQYDAYTRTFQLVDQEFRTLLEGEALYDLAIPMMFEEGEENLLVAASPSIAHA